MIKNIFLIHCFLLSLLFSGKIFVTTPKYFTNLSSIKLKIEERPEENRNGESYSHCYFGFCIDYGDYYNKLIFYGRVYRFRNKQILGENLFSAKLSLGANDIKDKDDLQENEIALKITWSSVKRFNVHGPPHYYDLDFYLINADDSKLRWYKDDENMISAVYVDNNIELFTISDLQTNEMHTAKFNFANNLEFVGCWEKTYLEKCSDFLNSIFSEQSGYQKIKSS